jgi:hypothetical protein
VQEKGWWRRGGGTAADAVERAEVQSSPSQCLAGGLEHDKEDAYVALP